MTGSADSCVRRLRVRPKDDRNLEDCYALFRVQRHSKLGSNAANGRDGATTDVFIEGFLRARSQNSKSPLSMVPYKPLSRRLSTA